MPLHLRGGFKHIRDFQKRYNIKVDFDFEKSHKKHWGRRWLQFREEFEEEDPFNFEDEMEMIDMAMDDMPKKHHRGHHNRRHERRGREEENFERPNHGKHHPPHPPILPLIFLKIVLAFYFYYLKKFEKSLENKVEKKQENKECNWGFNCHTQAQCCNIQGNCCEDKDKQFPEVCAP